MEEAVNPGGKSGMEEQAVDSDSFFEWYLKVSGKTLVHITGVR
eukprot:COSAG04_NODE_6020_length_1430_cov_1.349361_2_plen_43_part_00